MIAIGTDTYGTDANILFLEYATSDTKSITARVQRSKTLDGGVAITHLGFSHGDRTIVIEALVTETQETTIMNIVENYTSHHMTTREGFFTGVLEVASMRNGLITLTFLVDEKIT